MPQISGVGLAQTYTTLAAWVAAESGSDYGVGNPAIAEITGALPAGADITGVFVRGYIVRAKAGEEFNHETLAGASAAGIIRLASTTIGSACEVRDIIYNGSDTFNVADNFITNCEITATSGTAIDVSGRNLTASGLIFTGVPSRCFDSAGGGGQTLLADKCLSLGVSGTFSFVRMLATNCLHIGGGTGFAASLTGSDFNASDDVSSPGANSLDNRTTADLVNFAGGDYRTASASALSTAGLGGTFIGFALEVSGEITVTGNTANFNHNAIAASIELTGSIEVTGSTASFDYSAITGSVDLTGAISITGQTANFDYSDVNGLIDLTGELLITGQTANFDYTANPADIDLTGEITVTGATSNFDHTGVNGAIELGAVISVVGQTANFDINGVNAEVSLTGEIVVTGQTAIFNYTAMSGSVIIGTGQKIGKVTAGFADSGISVQYKQSTITVKFGE